MGQTDLKPTAQGQVESSINDTINFIMAKVAAGEIDAATATELIAAARKDYESNVPVTTSAQQAVQLQQTANPYQADPQTALRKTKMLLCLRSGPLITSTYAINVLKRPSEPLRRNSRQLAKTSYFTYPYIVA